MMMNQITIFILAVFTLIAMPIRAVSAPVVDVKKDYYWVSGRTARDIRNDLNMKTPVREDGMKYDARTDWFVKWTFWWNESSSLCTIIKVETRADIHYVLPKLRRSGWIPNSLKQKWESYMKALLHHENEHKDLGVRAAREIEKEIGNMAARRACKQLEIDANRLGHKIMKKFNDLEREYDRKTNHGMNDRAVFP
jgi:predicted secreted Zn-dependent protease